MGSVRLEVFYNGHSFDVLVPDTDMIQLMDLIGDFRVESMKQNVLIPDVYDIYYKLNNNGEKMNVKDNMALVDMFTSLEGLKTINVWLMDTINPIKEFHLYEDLRKKQEEKERSEEEMGKLEREAIFVEPLSMEVPVSDIDTNEIYFVRYLNSQEVFDEPLQNEPLQIESPQNEPPQTPRMDKHTQSSQPYLTADRFAPTTHFPTHSSQNKPPKKHPQAQRKMPISTARRKGIPVPKTKVVVNDENGGSGEKDRAKRKGKGIINEADGANVDGISEDSEDSDYVYNVESDGSDTDSGEGENSDFEVEGTSDTVEEERPVSHPFDGTMTLVDDDETTETYLNRVFKNGKMYVPQRWGNITLTQWTMFATKADFLDVLADYCVQEGFWLIIHKSDPRRLRGECSGLECTWKIHAAILPDGITWAIKRLSGCHTSCTTQKNNPMATTTWMANKMKQELAAQPEMPVKTMVQWFMDKFGIDVCLRTMYKVRIAAAEKIHGGHEQSYNLLAAYGEIIKLTNPGSHVLITWSKSNDNTHHFKAMFISFGACINGFLRGCRPLIGVDGCHLSGRYKGMLLSALALDGNNQIFCIGYAIVGKESIETWAYFFRNLSIAFKQHGCVKWDWAFISDRMKGVEKALKKEFPRCTRRICAHHLYINFKEKWSGPAYHDIFWEAANATSFVRYEKALERMGRLSKDAVAYLHKIPQQWSKHTFDQDVACDHNTSNFVESFNALAKSLRRKSVFELIDGIRVYCMDKIAERLELAESLEDNELTPYAKTKVLQNCAQSNHCLVISAGGGEYEVHDGDKAYPVNILRGLCSCGEWQVSGLPCKHACRAIYDNKEEPLHYAHGFFRGICYKLTYGQHMHPIPDKDQWPTFYFPVVFPPVQERRIGRPAKNRKRKADEPRVSKRSTTITCSICKNLGHNARSCQGGPTAKVKRAAVRVQRRKDNNGASSSKKKVNNGADGSSGGPT